MARRLLDFDPPDRFVAGAVGQPGARTFYLQVRSGDRIASVALDKAQLSVLAERVDALLDEVLRRGESTVPALAAGDTEDTDPLELPVHEEFQVGAMSLAWDTATERIVIECFSEDADIPLGTGKEDLTSGEGTVLRVTMTGTTARAFAQRSLAVVTSGRPPCPFCGAPLDPAQGHICPRSNGYRR
jgi:uncharacterized repeat protein (TIGR03847 family)